MRRVDNGFTLVELIIITPIVILAIGAFVTVLVDMLGDVLVSRAKGILAYEIHDTLSRMEDDIRLSSSFLATNSFVLTSPQGFSNDTTAFVNADTTKGPSLILAFPTTVGNPVSGGTSYVYLTNSPNACNSPSLRQNSRLEANIIYFTKNNSLWRRVVMPSNYATVGCVTPWQLPSCAPTISAAFCKTVDSELVHGVSSSGITIDYFSSPNAATANTQAGNPSVALATRAPIVQSMKSVQISINASEDVSNQTVTWSGSRRISLQD